MANFLKVLSPVFLLVGLLHLVIGVNADVMLGALLDAGAVSDPVLDSQNRFYGVAFSVYGGLFYLCATDLPKYQKVLKMLLWVFFAAGCARLVSIAIHGAPSIPVLGLLGTELTLPPLCHLWLYKTLGVHGASDARKTAARFFDEFVVAFKTFDGLVVAKRYYQPFVAVRADGVATCLQTTAETAIYFQRFLDDYYADGCRSCGYRNLDAVAVGQSGLLATVTWELYDASSDVVASWRESYNLVQLDSELLVLSSVDHD